MEAFMVRSILFAACFFTAFLFGDTFEGQYAVSGYDPYAQVTYTGEAQITRMGDNVYQIVWNFADSNQPSVGTGMLRNNTLSVVFLTVQGDEEMYGLQIYSVENGNLSGKWIYLQGAKLGTETLTKMESQK